MILLVAAQVHDHGFFPAQQEQIHSGKDEEHHPGRSAEPWTCQPTASADPHSRGGVRRWGATWGRLSRGKHLGRPPVTGPEQVRYARGMLIRPDDSVASAARFSVSQGRRCTSTC